MKASEKLILDIAQDIEFKLLRYSVENSSIDTSATLAYSRASAAVNKMLTKGSDYGFLAIIEDFDNQIKTKTS